MPKKLKRGRRKGRRSKKLKKRRQRRGPKLLNKSMRIAKRALALINKYTRSRTQTALKMGGNVLYCAENVCAYKFEFALARTRIQELFAKRRIMETTSAGVLQETTASVIDPSPSSYHSNLRLQIVSSQMKINFRNNYGVPCYMQLGWFSCQNDSGDAPITRFQNSMLQGKQSTTAATDVWFNMRDAGKFFHHDWKPNHYKTVFLAPGAQYTAVIKGPAGKVMNHALNDNDSQAYQGGWSYLMGMRLQGVVAGGGISTNDVHGWESCKVDYIWTTEHKYRFISGFDVGYVHDEGKDLDPNVKVETGLDTGAVEAGVPTV